MSETTQPDPLIAYLMEKNPQSISELRELTDGLLLSLNADLPEIGASHDDITIDSANNVTADVHVPLGQGPFPVIVYFHGGGGLMGSSKTHRKLGFRLAEAGFLVVNVNYRLAPEHAFPAAIDDCNAALQWAREHVAEFQGDPNRIAIAGDSMGGNLAAVIGTSEPRPDYLKAVALIYPAMEMESWPQKAAMVPEGVPNMLEMMLVGYLGPDYASKVADKRVSPLAEASKLPPTFLTCGSEDVTVYDGCQALEARLKETGVSHEVVFYEGLPHAFVQMEEQFPAAREAIGKLTDFLKNHV